MFPRSLWKNQTLHIKTTNKSYRRQKGEVLRGIFGSEGGSSVGAPRAACAPGLGLRGGLDSSGWKGEEQLQGRGWPEQRSEMDKNRQL